MNGIVGLLLRCTKHILLRCFPRVASLYISTVIIIGILQTFTWIVFFTIALTMWRRSYKAVTIQYPATTKPKELKKNVSILFTLSILLGLSWIIVVVGFLNRNNPTVGSPMLFVAGVIDFFQGPMLFLVQGIGLSKIRQTWRRWLCCKCCEMNLSLKTSSHVSPNSYSLDGRL